MSAIFFLLLGVPFFVCGLNAWLNRRPGADPVRTPFTSGRVAGVVFLPAYALVHWQAAGFDVGQMLCGLALVAVYVAGVTIVNWFVFMLNDASMHVRLLMQISEAGAVSPAELIGRYNKNAIMSNRIPRLVALGQLRLESGRLFPAGNSALLAARVCVWLRKILGIPLRPAPPCS